MPELSLLHFHFNQVDNAGQKTLKERVTAVRIVFDRPAKVSTIAKAFNQKETHQETTWRN